MKLKAGYGYWDCTHYPIGGSFRRADDNLVIVKLVEKIDPPQRGCNVIGMTNDNRRIALHTDHVEASQVEYINALNDLNAKS